MADSEKPLPEQIPLINHRSLDPALKRNMCQLAERVLNLHAVRDEATAGIKEVYQEAKNYGLSAKALRKAIKIRRDTDSDHREMEDIRDAYLEILDEGNV